MITGGIKGGKMWKKALKEIADKSNLELRVGIVKTATTFDGDNIAQYAYWNEYGTKEGIPARPFMRQTFDAHKGEWDSKVKALIKANPKSARGAFRAVGVLAVAQMNETIEKTGNFAPNAPSTIAAKEKLRDKDGNIVRDYIRDANGKAVRGSKGKGAAKLRGNGRGAPPPLVDTGQMEEAIKYEVVTK